MTDVMKTTGRGRAVHIIHTTVLSLLVLFSSLQAAHADDTEVFFSARSGTINQSQANVMLILDTSSSMTNTDSGQSGTRIERMKIALDQILRNATGVNIGLMRFNAPGGPVLYPVSDIDGVVEEGSSVLVRDVLLDVVAEDMEAAGGQSWGSTPIVDVLYEAGQYFRGGPVRYGKNRGYDGGPSSGYKTAQKRQFNRLSHPKSYTNGTIVRTGACNDGDLNALSCISEKIIDDDPTDGVSGPVYISPMTDECQANHIVLLSDGEATINDSSPYVIDLLDISESECNSRTTGEKCGLNLAEFLSHEDQSDLPDDQTITVRTIGFNLDGDGQVFLNKMASKGGSGAAEEASSAAELLTVFEKVLDNVDETESTFATPGVAVSSYNRLNHADDLYFSLFKPENTPLWGGNLKKYKLSDGKVISKEGDTVSAVGSDGYFTDSSQDYWSTVSRGSDGYDGSKVGVGGMLESLKDASSRKVLTYLGNYSKNGLAQSFTEIEDSDKAEDNSGLTKEVLNIVGEDDATRGELIQWVVDKTRVADPLHSSPHIVTYSASKSIVYFGDNQGFLHAVDSDSGEEVFAFMPQELLANQTILKNGVPGEEHLYGLDGGVTTWINDLDGNDEISLTESAYLYIGMRRGGKNYYALDVTNPSNPKLQWVIEGGKGDFAELGQSWSQPTKARVIIGSEAKDVLIFAAGYDEDQDDALVRTVDTEGRGIFMVDALTGEKLWSGGAGSGMDDTFDDMKYSIPSRVVALDLNADGYTEKMYVGDMGGQLWRFDIANGKDGADLVNGGVVFTASADGNAAENRRFYHEPDLSLYRKNREQILAIKIGSGFQAHPLLKNDGEATPQTSTDRFYMVKDSNVRSVPSSYVNLVESNLYDATDNLIGEELKGGVQTIQQTNLDQKNGWYITLGRDGEKVLASSLTVNDEVYFTTFEPSSSVEPCEPVPGVARVYQVNVANATPVGEAMDDLTAIDRETVLDTGFIAPTPIRVVVDGKELILAGPEIISEPTAFARKYTKTFWQEQ